MKRRGGAEKVTIGLRDMTVSKGNASYDRHEFPRSVVVSSSYWGEHVRYEPVEAWGGAS